MKRYDTSIKMLMKAQLDAIIDGTNPIFLSDWDSNYDNVKMPEIKNNNLNNHNLQQYYFWTDEKNYKEHIQSFFKQSFDYNLDKDEFAIGSNGTSSIMLSLAALKEMGKNKALLVTPIYFSTLNLLDEFEFETIHYHLKMSEGFSFDTAILEMLVKNNRIDLLILTLPFFGSGVEIPNGVAKDIVEICNRYSICLFVDYVYGGLRWNEANKINYIFNFDFFRIVSQANQYIMIESISKRLFINGAKFSLLLTTPPMLRRILRLSVFMVGSMALQQMDLVPQIYSINRTHTISSLISENAFTAKEHYKLVSSLIVNTKLKVAESNCGYFTLLSFPYDKAADDMEYSVSLLKRTGVLTIPHSRYLLFNESMYSFRINLLLNKMALINGISRIKEIL